MQITDQSAFYQNFEPGDLIYGLNEPRSDYRQAARNKLMPNGCELHTNDEPYQTDGKFLIVDDYIGFIEPYISKQNYKLPEKTPNEAKLFFDYLINGKHDFQFNTVDPSDYTDDSYLVELRRAMCKAGLFYQPNKKIRVCLDGIEDEKAIVNGFYYDFSKKKLYSDTFTSEEFRTISENWNALKHRVIFYKEGNVVPAPRWITDLEYRQELIMRRDAIKAYKEQCEKKAGRPDYSDVQPEPFNLMNFFKETGEDPVLLDAMNDVYSRTAALGYGFRSQSLFNGAVRKLRADQGRNSVLGKRQRPKPVPLDDEEVTFGGESPRPGRPKCGRC